MDQSTPARYQRSQAYAAELTPVQAEVFALWRAGATWFYNEAARSQRERSRGRCGRGRPGIESLMQLGYAVSVARKAGCEFQHGGQAHLISEVPAGMLHGALRHLSDSWTRHLRAVKAGKRSSAPRFRSVRRGGSLYWQTQEGSRPCSISDLFTVVRPGHALFRVPQPRRGEQLPGGIRIRYHRELPADAMVRFASLGVDDTGKYWVMVQYDTAQVRQPSATGIVGVDRGVVVTAATSDGQVYDAPGLSEGQAARMRRLQRGLSRKRRLNPCSHDTWVTVGSRSRLRRGFCPPPSHPDHDCACWKHSRRYERDKLAFVKLTQRQARQRKNGAHLASRALADQYAVVVMEDLDVSAMTASATVSVRDATPARYGRRAKAGLNREILASNWYQFEQFTAYKTELVKVPAPYTSQACPACGHVDSANRPERDVFRCTGCGLTGHADIIAARNILTAGALSVAAREICDVAGRQPANSQNNSTADRERSGGEPDAGQRSHAGQAADLATQPVGPLVPEGWGLGTARKRPGHRRSGRRARASGRKAA